MDRNTSCLSAVSIAEVSLSARRAWIEMLHLGLLIKEGTVALRKESVDRNSEGWQVVCADFGSLSARRAWIEIFACFFFLRGFVCRSPQGERG